MKKENQNGFLGEKNFIVTEVREKKNGYINPVIVTFQNGEIKDQHASECKVSLTPGSNGCTNVEIRTSYDHVFKISNVSERAFPRQNVAIRNKKTNKVKIVEVDIADLINSALLNSPETNETEADHAKAVRTLKKTFGGKKIVSRMEQKEKFSISSLPIPDDAKKIAEDIKVEENVSLNNTEVESLSYLLPPCHRDTKVLGNVYNLNEILSDKELLALKTKLNSPEESETSVKKYSQFFYECLAEASTSEENLYDRMAGILFAECLINFLSMPAKKVTSKTAVLCPFSSVIHEKLMNEFCVRTDTSISRPLTMRDKCLCYIIVLILICNNYRINLKLLSEAVSVHLTKLTRLARVVGAVPLSKTENVFVLKLPLPALPKSSIRKRKNK